MEIPKIHESEYRFCLIMWEHEPVTAVELVYLSRGSFYSRTRIGRNNCILCIEGCL